jgi:A/G-specific adenine glycosylase
MKTSSGKGDRVESADRATPDADAFRRDLLEFYQRRRRDLPWRRSRDPYRVWISEVMLQQTRVDVVIPFYERWLERFPTASVLADADEDSVLKAWEGLGYYARARNLRRAARVVRDRHGGTMPADVETLRTLPGVGEYTAGAIASIAHGRPAVAIDGNVRRVFARLLDEAAPRSAQLRAFATHLLDPQQPGEFNQSLMELGALVCTPRAPRCGVCPVARHCGAFQSGTQLQRPAPRRARIVPRCEIGTAVITDARDHVLLVRRGERGLLAGLWSFPGEPARSAEPPSAAARRAARTILAGVQLPRGRRLGEITHSFTHRIETYHCFHYRLALPFPALSPPFAALAPSELEAFALPAAQRRIAALLG